VACIVFKLVLVAILIISWFFSNCTTRPLNFSYFNFSTFHRKSFLKLLVLKMRIINVKLDFLN